MQPATINQGGRKLREPIRLNNHLKTDHGETLHDGNGDRHDPPIKADFAQLIVGMTKLAPSLTPDGQREVTVLVLV